MTTKAHKAHLFGRPKKKAAPKVAVKGDKPTKKKKAAVKCSRMKKAQRKNRAAVKERNAPIPKLTDERLILINAALRADGRGEEMDIIKARIALIGDKL